MQADIAELRRQTAGAHALSKPIPTGTGPKAVPPHIKACVDAGNKHKASKDSLLGIDAGCVQVTSRALTKDKNGWFLRHECRMCEGDLLGNDTF
eukprot:1156903-Pelagomonas_calceolata.AAC.3